MSLMKRREQQYEYDFVAVNDRYGRADIDAISYITERHARDGWRLVTVFTNELGKNATSFAGVGINSTVDQSILVFEREVIPEEKLLEEKSFHVAAPITESNIISPFMPKSITFFEKDGNLFATLCIDAPIAFSLKALQGDLIVKNMLDDQATITDVCFFSFTLEHGLLVSTPFPVQLPDKIRYGISTAGLSVKRYIGNGNLIIPENTAAASISDKLDAIAEERAEKAKSNPFGQFLIEAEKLSMASEIYDLAQRVAKANPNVFTEDTLHRLSMFVKMEQSYGCAKSGTMRYLKQYFEEMGIL